MSYHERVSNACIGHERADLVLAGCAILEAIRRRFPCPRLRIADRGLREGMLVEMMREDGRDGRCRRLTEHKARSMARTRPAGCTCTVKTRRQAQAVLEALAGAPAQRSLCRARPRREGYRSRAAFKLQEIDDKLQAPEARQARGRSRRGARRLEPDRAPKRRCGSSGKGAVVGIDLSPVDPIAGVDLRQMDFLDEDAPEQSARACSAAAPIVVMSRHGGQHHRPSQDRPSAHHRPGRDRRRLRAARC